MPDFIKSLNNMEKLSHSWNVRAKEFHNTMYCRMASSEAKLLGNKYVLFANMSLGWELMLRSAALFIEISREIGM